MFTKSLVTFQFVLSIGLIIATVIILQQLSFMHSKNLGFAKENVVVVNTSGADAKKIYPLFRQALQSNPGILGMTGSSMGLGAQEGQMGGGYEFNGKTSGVIEYPVDPYYLKVMNMRLIAGRHFDPAIVSDTINSIIVNESLVKNFLGLTPQEALGKQILGRKNHKPRTIIGVTEDFNFEDLTRTVRPQLFSQPADFTPSRIFVRINPGDPSATLASLESAWKTIVPDDIPFSYSFLDEKFARFYESEKRWSSIVGWAGGISIFLASLGLFGLAALAAVNRTKEIGIRKVMGAGVISIVGLLSKDFLKLVIIALVIASPLVWYFMNDWLKDYAYRIHIGWWVFAVTGVIAVIIALLTIGLQTIKAAMANPVKSLRTE
jgi:putative ABC transport system permease protein